jgi:hypothetical protein
MTILLWRFETVAFERCVVFVCPKIRISEGAKKGNNNSRRKNSSSNYTTVHLDDLKFAEFGCLKSQ